MKMPTQSGAVASKQVGDWEEGGGGGGGGSLLNIRLHLSKN